MKINEALELVIRLALNSHELNTDSGKAIRLTRQLKDMFSGGTLSHNSMDRVGFQIQDLLGLDVKENGRVDTSGGDKTPVGLARAVLRLVAEESETETKPLNIQNPVDRKYANAFHELYDLEAKKEGWLITNDSDGYLVIAKVDDPMAWIDDGTPLDYTEPKFGYDEEAIEHVTKMAEDSLWHTHALRIHNSRIPAH